MKISAPLSVLLSLGLGASLSSADKNPTIDHGPFADELTVELYTTDPPENECTSSLGVSMALGLVYPAAISESEEQMRNVLGYPSDSQSFLLWENITTDLTTRYQGRCFNPQGRNCNGEEPTLEIANSVFVHDNVTLNATYVAVVGDLVQQLDFTSQEAGGIVNSWVNDTTNGLIDSIVEEGSLEDIFMLAVNSIYLKAAWRETFNTLYTNQDLFYVGDGNTTSDAHFMHQIDYFPYSHEALPGYQILQLGFSGDYSSGSSGMSMIFVLPVEGYETAVMKSANATASSESSSSTATLASSVDVLSAIPNLVRTRVALAIPKFRFEAKYEENLKEALDAMGMKAPFQQRPDNMCIVEGRCDAYIDLIIQKTFIDVNEDGVEAAAVTAVGIALTSAGPPPVPPIKFQADRPFQFFLYDDTQQLILFEGQVGEPGIVEGSEARNPNKHADDFFKTVFNVQAVSVTPPGVLVEGEFEVPPPMDSIVKPNAPVDPEEEEEDNLVSTTRDGTHSAATDSTATDKEEEKAEAPQQPVASAPDASTTSSATIIGKVAALVAGLLIALGSF